MISPHNEAIIRRGVSASVEAWDADQSRWWERYLARKRKWWRKLARKVRGIIK